MSNEVWYRTWRPQRFAEVAGQGHVTRTLANAVALRRVAHAYLFAGPRGTGKTSTARILAKAVNCTANVDGEPCNRCPNCLAVAEGRALDLVEMDAASNRGIDEIRSLRDKVGYSPTSSAYKVYLIDEVHELTANAFDALLKTLEEPPPHVIFILATTEAERVPATVASRCQRFDFRRIRLPDVVARLRQVCEGESVELPDDALVLIARRATGSLRDAVNLLEQAVASCGSGASPAEVEEAIGGGGEARAAVVIRHALTHDLAAAFHALATAMDDGIEPRQLQRAALGRLRALMLVKAGAEDSLELGDEAIAELRAEAAETELDAILRLLRLLSAADFRGDAHSPLPLELALAQAVLSPPPPAAPVSIVSGRDRDREPPPVRESRAPKAADPPAADRSPRPLAPLSSPRPPIEREPAAAPAEEADVAPEPDGAESNGDGSGWADAPVRESIAGELTVARLQALMRSVYDRLRERNPRASAYINSPCNVVELRDETIVLAFKHELLAAKVKSEEGGRHISEIEAAIESLSGRRYPVVVTVDPAVDDWHRRPATARTSHLLDEAEKLGLRRDDS